MAMDKIWTVLINSTKVDRSANEKYRTTTLVHSAAILDTSGMVRSSRLSKSEIRLQIVFQLTFLTQKILTSHDKWNVA